MLRNSPPGFSATTRDIRVIVAAVFLEDQSDDTTYVWAYQVRVENHGRATVQLLRRTWRITDARGRVQVVQGDGVVGQQPVLEPGEAFDYTSGTPLDTPSGIMAGHYHMVDVVSGEAFDVEIPAFSLDSPNPLQRVH